MAAPDYQIASSSEALMRSRHSSREQIRPNVNLMNARQRKEKNTPRKVSTIKRARACSNDNSRTEKQKTECEANERSEEKTFCFFYLLIGA